MSQFEELKRLKQRIQHGELKPETEEATKQWFILPMFNILGYNIYSENVVSEYSADFGNKKGERVDYYLRQLNNKSIIVECKDANTKLNAIHIRQLAGYYHNLASKDDKPEVAILTNGIQWQFFKEAKPNIMSDKPFLIIDLLNDSDNHIEKILQFAYNYNEKLKVLSEIKGTMNKLGEILGNNKEVTTMTNNIKQATNYEELSSAIDFINEHYDNIEHISYQQNEIIRNITHLMELLEDAYYQGDLDNETFEKTKRIIIAYVSALTTLESMDESQIRCKQFTMEVNSTKFNIERDSVLNGFISDNKIKITINEIVEITDRIKEANNRKDSKDEVIVKYIQRLNRTVENMENDLKWMIPDFAPIEYLNRHNKLVQKL